MDKLIKSTLDAVRKKLKKSEDKLISKDKKLDKQCPARKKADRRR